MGKGSGSGKGAVVVESKTTLASAQAPSKNQVHITPKGLENVGNTCYANAALQCLLSTSLSHALLEPQTLAIFRGYASNSSLLAVGSGSVDSEDVDEERRSERLSRREQRRKRREEKKMHEKCDWLTQQLTQITREYASPEPHASSSAWFYEKPAIVIDPGSITKHPDRLSKCLRPYQQEDAHEFMRALLSTLTMNGHNKRLSSLFDGLLESAVTCQVCRRASLTRDRYMDLSLDIVSDHVNTLGDALCEFTKTELLDCDNKVMCTPCGRKEPVAKGLRLATAPSILVCHLKRFAFDDFGRMIRLHKHIHFPLRLEIGDYMSRMNKAKPPPYELVAVLVHQGRSCDSGHYLAYVKNHNEWYKANDSMISKVDVETVLSQQAYILMYEVAGMRRNTMLRFKPVQNSWKHEDLPQAPQFQGSMAPEPENTRSSLLNLLCSVSEANEAILRDFCCGATSIVAPGKGKKSRVHVSDYPVEEFAVPGNENRDLIRTMQRDGPPECDSTVCDGSTVYTTDSSQISVLRRSTSGGNLREFENEASRAYRSPTGRSRTHSFAESEPGVGTKDQPVRSQSARKPRTYSAGRGKPPSPSPTRDRTRPPLPGHRRRHTSGPKLTV